MNRLKFIIYIFALCFSGYASAVGAINRIVILGDSISDGYGVATEAAYPFLLEKKLRDFKKRDIKVISSSVSGSTTASGPGRIKWIMKLKPELILIALGGNDGLRGISVAESQTNLEKTIEEIEKVKVKVILVGMKMPPNYGAQYAKEFYQTFEAVSRKKGIPLVPFLLERVGGEKSMNQTDGIHPNEPGHKIIAETLFDFLKDKL